MTRRPQAHLVSLLVLAALVTTPSTRPLAGQSRPSVDYDLVRDLMSPERKTRRRAAKGLLRARQPSLIPVVADALFFIPRAARDEALSVLEELSGERRGRRYLDWVELVGAREDIALPAGYREWKRSLLERIDPRFRGMLPDDATARIRLEELVWGGVRVEGIPALERPPKVAATEADFMLADDRVFGVALADRFHAYPVKVLGWHEMVNDSLAGRPFTLSYCTLCGSGVLYDTARDGAEPLTFGTSGLLYRSNKLMIDRQGGSLWSNLTGEAVIGAAAAREERLEMLPVTLTTWKRWLEAHPDTTVAQPDPELGKRFGYDYTEGAADRRREGVSFPVWQKSDRLEERAEVLALRVDGRAKAYELDALVAAGVVNDTLGDIALVALIGPDGGARAYRRGDHTFDRLDSGALVDREGRRWTITESALKPPLQGALGTPENAVETLERLPTHIAFWFGWYGVFPDTEVFPDGA